MPKHSRQTWKSIPTAPFALHAAIALAMVLHTTIAAVLVAQMSAAYASPDGDGLVVFCTPDGLKTVRLVDLPNGDAPSAYGCTCACGAICGGSGAVPPQEGVIHLPDSWASARTDWPRAPDPFTRSHIDLHSGEPRAPPGGHF